MELGQPIFQKTDGNEGITNFFRGFQLVAALNNQRQQQELAAQKMMQDQALRTRALDIEQQHYSNTFQVEQIQQKRILENERFQHGQTQSQVDAAANMMGDINAIPGDRNSQSWRDRAYDTLLKHPQASLSPEYKLLSQQVSKSVSNPSIKSQQSVLDNRIKTLGLDKKAVYRALNDPDTYTSSIPGNSDKIGIHVGDKPLPTAVAKTGGMVGNADPGLGGNKQTLITPTKLYVPVPKSTWDGLKTTFDSVNGTSDGTARVIPQPGVDEHQTEWQRARTALGSQNVDSSKVREIYQSKGFDPVELDADTPP